MLLAALLTVHDFGLFPYGSIIPFTSAREEPSPPRHLHTIPHCPGGIKCGPYVKQRELIVGRIHLATIIVVNDVTNFFATSVNDPVMAVKWKLIPEADLKSINITQARGTQVVIKQSWSFRHKFPLYHICLPNANIKIICPTPWVAVNVIYYCRNALTGIAVCKGESIYSTSQCPRWDLNPRPWS